MNLETIVDISQIKPIILVVTDTINNHTATSKTIEEFTSMIDTNNNQINSILPRDKNLATESQDDYHLREIPLVSCI